MKFDHLTLLTNQLDQLLPFYSLIPGAVVKGPSKAGYAEVQLGDSVFGVFDRAHLGSELGLDLGGSLVGTAIVQILVNDVDIMAKSLRDAGLKILAGPVDLPWGSRSIYVHDPDRNMVEFYRW